MNLGEAVENRLRSYPMNHKIQEDVNILDHKNPMKQKTEDVDKTVDYLVDKFNAPEYTPLFRKAAWRLPKGTIDRHVTAAFELAKQSKVGYFIALVKKEPAYNGFDNARG